MIKIKKGQKGSALALVLVVVAAVSIILTSLLGYISSQISYSKDRVERERAFQVSEAGIYFYRWYLAHEISGKTADQIQSFWQSTAPSPLGVDAPYEADFKDPEDNVVGRYRIEVTRPSSSSTIVTATSTGWTIKNPNIIRKVEVRFRRPSWSEYTFLSNSFMNFGDEAVVYGKVHSNDGIRFDGLAYNTVSSLKAHFDDPSWGGNNEEFGVHTTEAPADPNWTSGATPPVRSDVFVGGREFPVAEVAFAGVTTDLGNMKARAQAGNGRYFDNSGVGRRITLKNTTYDVCTVNSANSSTHAINNYSGYVNGATAPYAGTNGNACTSSSCCLLGSCPDISGNWRRGKCITGNSYSIINDGVIFVEDNAWIEGSVSSRRLSIAAADMSGGSKDIYIGISNNDLKIGAYDCDNMLGLVAQNDIRVLNDCPSNFTVDAALLAQNGRVGIVNGMGGKFSLTFNGAISSYLQPYFQTGMSGFADRTYNFNNNLLYCPPPYFPTGTEYFIDQWDEL